MVRFNEIAESEIEYNKQYLLADFNFAELLDYYWPSIEDAINDGFMRETWETDNPAYSYSRKWTTYEKERIQEYLISNAAELLSIGYGYGAVEGYFALTTIEEIDFSP